MNIRELLEKRATLIAEAREMVDKADAEKRGMTAEEETRYDALMNDATKIGADVERRQRLASMESVHDQEQPGSEQNDGGDYTFRCRGMQGRTWRELREREEWRASRGLHVAAPRFSPWLVDGARSFAPEEQRALQADSDIYGGYLYAPMAFVDRLIQAVDNLVFIRQWATIFTVPNAETLGAPSLDNDPADPTWTAELAIGSEDGTMSLGRRELQPHPLAKSIKISRKLLRKVPSVEMLVQDRLGYKFAVASENGFLNGSGANQPLGVFTASDQGISTGRDVSTGNTTTSIQFDGLTEAKFKLKTQYWTNARWLFHRDGVKQVAKLKDGNGQYVWRESVRVGEPDRIMNVPVFMSEYAPNTFTTGLYVGIIGDFSRYWIADSLEMEIQALMELYAATNQVGYIGRLETDGMPVLEEAFARVKLA